MKKTLLTKTLLLLFALIAGSSISWADDITVDFTSLGTQTWTSYSLTSGNVTISTDLGTGAEPTKSNAQYRWKTGNIITISTSTGTLKSIQFKTNSTETYGPKNLQYGGSAITSSGTNYTWTAPSGISSASFTVTSEARLTEIHVVYTTGGGSSVDAPSFSPAAGAVAAGTAVTLTQDAADAIRYTTDGTDPTKTTGTVYSEPIEITTATTIKAIAVKGDDVSSVATAVYTINVASPTFNLEGGNYMQGTTITITSTGNTIYYNMTTDGTSPSNPTSSSTPYTSPIVLGSGTTKIKAIAYDTYGNASSVVTRTYTGIAPASLPFSWTGTSSAGKAQLAEVIGVSVNLGSDYATGNAPYRLKFDGEGKNVTIYFNEKPENVYFTAKLFNAANTGSKIKVQGSADGVTFDDIEEFTIKGDANATFEFVTSHAFEATHKVVKLVMSSKDQNVAVGTICVSFVPATIGTSGYITLGAQYDLDHLKATPTDGLEAYVVTAVSGSAVTLEAIPHIPAGTGVILKGTPGTTYTIPIFQHGYTVSTNLLKVSDGSVTGGDGIYALAEKESVVGFYKVKNTVTIPAGKCYLNTVAGAPDFLGFGGDATGIDEVRGKTEEVRGEFYNLAGQRVAQPTKGLYIVNGKKVVMK